jgi:hypothetical protein
MRSLSERLAQRQRSTTPLPSSQLVRLGNEARALDERGLVTRNDLGDVVAAAAVRDCRLEFSSRAGPETYGASVEQRPKAATR